MLSKKIGAGRKLETPAYYLSRRVQFLPVKPRSTSHKGKNTIPQKKKKTSNFKICSRCTAENPVNASECKSCGKSRFEPSWVKGHRPLNRNFSVQITESNPNFGDVEKRITLYKWWPGGSSNFHFPKAGQWEKVVEIINNDLGPKLGWKTASELVDSAIKKGAKSKAGKQDIVRLAKDHPDFLKELVGAIDPDKLSKKDF